MIKLTKKKRNPVLRSINNIKYEIIDQPVYDEHNLIEKFSKILDKKLPSVKNKIPLILFEKLDKYGSYPYSENVIKLASNEDNSNNIMLRYLFHELGHFIYDKYLSNQALKEFDKYINRNRKPIDLDKVSYLFEKLTIDEFRINHPVEFVIVANLENTKEFKYYKNNINSKDKYAPYSPDFLDWFIIGKKGKQYKEFIKPPSNYIPTKEEIFCEIFANYMMYDLRLLHSDNYRILRYVLPELRN